MRATVFFLLGLLSYGQAQANSHEAELLIQGCGETGAIYDLRGERNLLAGFNTAVSEALRAGYCHGVIAQYRSTQTCSGDWLEQAKRIARLPVNRETSMKSILRESCG